MTRWVYGFGAGDNDGAVRTPVGRRGGKLSGWHATDLAAQPLAALLARNDLDPSLVEDVVMGCTMTVGEQAMNIARNAALAAGFPESVPGTTVDRQCGSAQQAIHFAAQAVMAGAMDVAIGAGIESMSRVPIGSTTEPGPGEAYGPLYLERFELIHQGECAEEIARRWEISREEMDEFALRSHQRALAAQAAGKLDAEILAVKTSIYEGEDSVLAWMLNGPQAHYVVPLPAPGEAKHAIMDSYTKEHSAEYQSQALIDLAFRMRENITDFDDVEKIVPSRRPMHREPDSGRDDPRHENKQSA